MYELNFKRLTLGVLLTTPLLITACGDDTTSADDDVGTDTAETVGDTGMDTAETGTGTGDTTSETGTTETDTGTTETDTGNTETGSTETGTTETGTGETDTGVMDTGTDTGGALCDPMDAMNGPEECFNPRGWFWNGSECEQILCTCEGSQCNELFPSIDACLEGYGECLPPNPCAPQEAFPVGDCEQILGTVWTGDDCVPLVGCECEGPDCGELYENPDLCFEAHLQCQPPPPNCDPEDAAGIGDCDQFFGYAWDGETCAAVNGCECVGADCGGLPLEPGVCEDEHAICEPPPPPPDCEPDDAKGNGPCEQFFGYAWDGMACVGVSGCNCQGLDCDALPQELAVCEEEHALCELPPPPPDCQPFDAQGIGLCALFLGYKWDGAECVGVSGCSCEGADCDLLFQDLDVCLGTCGG